LSFGIEPWKDLPDRYPSYQTCHRRFQRWVREGTLRRVLKALAADLHARGGLDLSGTFIDGSFASAKKRPAPPARVAAAAHNTGSSRRLSASRISSAWRRHQ
jgi:transposase